MMITDPARHKKQESTTVNLLENHKKTDRPNMNTRESKDQRRLNAPSKGFRRQTDFNAKKPRYSINLKLPVFWSQNSIPRPYLKKVLEYLILNFPPK